MFLREGARVSAIGLLRSAHGETFLFPPHAQRWLDFASADSVSTELAEASGTRIASCAGHPDSLHGERELVRVVGVWRDGSGIHDAETAPVSPPPSIPFDLSYVDEAAMEWNDSERHQRNSTEEVELSDSGALISLIAIARSANEHGLVATVDLEAPGGERVYEVLRQSYGRSVAFVRSLFDRQSIDRAIELVAEYETSRPHPVGIHIDPDFQTRIRFGVERLTPQIELAIRGTSPGLVDVRPWLAPA